MSDKPANEKPDKETNQTQEEPSLFEEKSPRRSKWRTKLFFVLLVLGTVAFLWPKDLIRGEAIVQAERFTRMGLTSSGILKELLHKKGDRVQKGELLARFENPELSRRFEEKKLALEILNHEKTRLQKQIEFLEKDTAGKNILFENGVIGRIQFEKANLDFTQAKEELVMREKEIESAEGEIRFLKEKVESLELRAPFDGMLLTDPGITVGNLLKEGDFVLEFADPKSFFLEILVPEKVVEKVKTGNSVKARFQAFSWKTYSGIVTKVGPRTTEEVEKIFNIKYVIPCEIKLDEFPADVKYGMRAYVMISGRHGASLKPASIPKPPADSFERFITPSVLETKAQKENSHDSANK